MWEGPKLAYRMDGGMDRQFYITVLNDSLEASFDY